MRTCSLHDLHLVAVGVGGNQLELLDVPADGSALRLDAATVQLHSQAPQTHPCVQVKVAYGYKMHGALSAWDDREVILHKNEAYLHCWQERSGIE